MFDHPATATRDIEINVLCDVIDAVEALLQQLESSDSTIVTSRPEAYAIFIQAVIASARATGHHGAGTLATAPLLDAILAGAEATPWDRAILTVLTNSLTAGSRRESGGL
ncbi:hypothetical protein [Nocardia crassostreae]|uniref:hypothetical protein n=1 Tax=Nocardia crassostreae TaxID=53428 RepID=UPI00083414E0|nr:hypothetical protein [Nocardia crassostreae]